MCGGESAPGASEARQAEFQRRMARGGGYRPLLARIHGHLRPRTYVEIGVAKGHTLVLALPATQAIGVDPEPALEVALPGSARLFRATSEEFFARHDTRELLAGRPIDLAFIDGLHLFEVALADFMHLEKACDRDSVILVHDCNPLDEESSARHRATYEWTGDVWQLVLCLKQYRPDLEIVTADVAPTGLGIVKDLDPSSTVLEERPRGDPVRVPGPRLRRLGRSGHRAQPHSRGLEHGPNLPATAPPTAARRARRHLIGPAPTGAP